MRKRKKSEEGGFNVWRSYSDMMAGVLLLFILIDFELMLLKIYGLDKYYDTIKQTLLHLYKTRFAVKEKKRKKA